MTYPVEMIIENGKVVSCRKIIEILKKESSLQENKLITYDRIMDMALADFQKRSVDEINLEYYKSDMSNPTVLSYVVKESGNVMIYNAIEGENSWMEHMPKT